MFIEYNYSTVKVPEEILSWCDEFTYDAQRHDLRYKDCVYYNMGLYGNDIEELKKMREQFQKELRILPVFQ